MWIVYFCFLITIIFRCAFGPTGPCGGTLAGKVVKKSDKSLYSTFMFSGTLFGGFCGHMFSGTIIPYAKLDGSYFILSVVGFIWAAVWVTMLHVTPYKRAEDASDHSMNLSSTPWSLILGSTPFIGLLIACFGYDFLTWLYTFAGLIIIVSKYNTSTLVSWFIFLCHLVLRK